MWAILRQNFVLPLVRRVGTAAAGFLVAIGASEGLAGQVEIGIGALALIAFDLSVSWWERHQRAGR